MFLVFPYLGALVPRAPNSSERGLVSYTPKTARPREVHVAWSFQCNAFLGESWSSGQDIDYGTQKGTALLEGPGRLSIRPK